MVELIGEVPDGGWGWAVVFGAALTNMMNQTLVSIFSLLYGEQIRRTSYGIQGVALVMNLNCLVTNFSGLLAGPLLKRRSARVVAATGVLLTAAGLMLSSRAVLMWHFIVTYSIFTGIGLGLIAPATFMAVHAYFDRRKGQAVGLAMAGTGVGQTLMPQVVTRLLDAYAFRGAALIMGAVALHGLVGSLLFQPVERHLKSASDKEDSETIALLPHDDDDAKIKTYGAKTAAAAAPSSKGSCDVDDACASAEKDNTHTMATTTTATATRRTTVGVFKRLARTLDLALLQDAVFVHIIIGLAIVYSSSIAFSVLFPLHLQRGVGLTRAETAACMSTLSAADIAARLSIPRIAQRVRVGFRTTFLCGAVALALARALLAVQTSYTTALAASALCGYVRAATVINQNLTVAEYCDPSRLPTALGLNMVAKGVLVLTLGQFFAWVRDYTDSYVLCIHVQSACLLLVALTWGGEMLLRRRRHRLRTRLDGGSGKLTSPRTS